MTQDRHKEEKQCIELLDLSLDLAVSMAKAGSETSRAEDSVRRVLQSFDLVNVDVFALANFISVSFSSKDGNNYTRGKCINDKRDNLDALAQFNTISRELCQHIISPSEAQARIKQIEAEADASIYTRMFASFCIAFGFCFLLGGTLLSSIWAGVAGALVRILIKPMLDINVNKIFINIAGGAVASILLIPAGHIGVTSETGPMLIGIFMNLVPGMALTNSLRDIVAADYISGLTKLTEALLTATAIAIGAGLIYSLGWL